MIRQKQCRKSAKTRRFHEAWTQRRLQLPFLKSFCEDVCNELATNFSIYDVIIILPKLPVSESIAFSGVCKPLGLPLFQLPRIPHHKIISTLKRLRTYLHTTRAYKRKIQDVHPGTGRRMVAGNRKNEIVYAKFFCNQAQNYQCSW